MIKTKIQTYTAVVGNEACNAKCPYCISKMTPNYGLGYKKPEVNWRNFEIGCKLAEKHSVDTMLLTGKGEPTLHPELINDYLDHISKYNFPFIELQTNGLIFSEKKEEYTRYLKEWYDKGMTTIALSVVHYDNNKNKEILTRDRAYPDLAELVQHLHNIKGQDQGYSVRLSVMLAKGYLEETGDLEKLVDFAKENNIEQLTVRRVERPYHARDGDAAKWVDDHYLSNEKIDEFREFLDKHGTRLRELVHGAVVYDYKGQNICLNNCLTIDAGKEEIRQLIFFPDGHLRYDWQHKGAIII